jgi:excinuclease ABC subunit C
LKLRKRDLEKKRIQGRTFGPYPSAYRVTELLKLVRPIFPWCNATRGNKMRRCFENHLGLCPGVCTGKITAQAYQQTIEQLALFLRGQTRGVTTKIKTQLLTASQALEFEDAAVFRDQLTLIKEITSETYKLRHDLFLPNLNVDRAENALLILKQILSESQNLPREYQLERIEGYDVSNISGQQAVVSMVVFTQGQANKQEYRSFNIKTLNSPNDFAMLAEALSRRVKHAPDWGTPSLLLIDGGKGQVRAVLEVLRDTIWQTLPIIGLAKDPDRIVIPTQIARQNAGVRLKIDWQIKRLPEDNLALQLLQQVRDEAHRFGKSRHLIRREKDFFAQNKKK